MRNYIKILCLLVLATTFSCEKDYFVQCPDCTAEEPSWADIEVQLESDYTGVVIVEIYEGNLEDNILIGTYHTSSTLFATSLRINKKYSITSTYVINKKKYTAVDSIFPRVRFTKLRCANPCYYIYDRKLDLSLNYTK